MYGLIFENFSGYIKVRLSAYNLDFSVILEISNILMKFPEIYEKISRGIFMEDHIP